MRLACDTGGTFTDLLVEAGDGGARMYKAPTTPSNPIDGVIAALELAATDLGVNLQSLLGGADMFIHGTTHAINAVVTGSTARTALLTTLGHPDVLVLREGGRKDPFDHEIPFPAPYVPRHLTYEVPERIDYSGKVLLLLDEKAVRDIIGQMQASRVEAVACCLLWSISNPAHELRIGELLDEAMPGIPFTLSHQLNPSLREYRRAISASIDASLKPTMVRYLGTLRSKLQDSGFRGRLLVQTSQGGMADAGALARTPIHSLNSGPALAPVAGRAIAIAAGVAGDVIVADTGGTTYDISLVRDGRLPMTRETWIGPPYQGHMTGFPSVDVKSIGAGGGSVAWLDDAGLLRVGPKSAGAKPGPACFGLGGKLPTLTDAALVLGYIDPEYFLGGAMRLDRSAANHAIELISEPLKLTREATALAIYRVATENMVQAILDITVRQGIDPTETVLIGGGGAAGLNSDAIGRRLGCRRVIIPGVGAALSAAGALISDIKTDVRRTFFCTTANLPIDAVQKMLSELAAGCRQFANDAGAQPDEWQIEFSMEARYPNQVWEIDVPLSDVGASCSVDIDALREQFHRTHQLLFGFDERTSEIEIVTWCATVRWAVPGASAHALRLRSDSHQRTTRPRLAWFDGSDDPLETPVYDLRDVGHGASIQGPALIETRYTTVVVEPGSRISFDSNVGLTLSRETSV